MSLHYDWYKTPVPNHRGETPKLHARVVESGTIDSESLAERLETITTLTQGDVAGVLVSLVDEMARRLTEGYRVHIRGLGYFRLTLKHPATQNEKEIRAESIEIKNIVFRPEQSFKKRFNGLHPEKVEAGRKSHSQTYDEGQADEKLRQFFSAHSLMKSSEFQSLFGLTRTTAARRLAELIAEGKIKKTGHYHSPLYIPGENLNLIK